MSDLAYSIKDVCRTAKLGRTSIYASIKSGQLKARKISRRTIILHDDLVQFLNTLPTFGPSYDDQLIQFTSVPKDL